MKEPDNDTAQCGQCGSDMQLVRPGKWQCDTCEGKAFIRRKQAEAVEWAAGDGCCYYCRQKLLEQADAIRRGEVET